MLTLAWLILCPAIAALAKNVAVLKSDDFAPYDETLAGFANTCENELREYNLDGKAENAGRIVAAVSEHRPDLVLAIGVLAAQVAQQRLQDFPVLFVMVPRPVELGLTGDNIAGIALDIPAGRQLEMYRSIVPGLSSLGVIYDPAKSGPLIDEARAAAARVGIELVAEPVDSRKRVPGALRGLLRRIDALWMVPDETVVTPESFKFLLLTSFENNLPFLAASDIFVKVGALASLTPDYRDIGRQGCELAMELASGDLRLADEHVIAPAKVNVTINLKTARKIGVAIPDEIVSAAHAVYR